MAKLYKKHRIPVEFYNSLQKLKIHGVISNQQDMFRKFSIGMEDWLNNFLESEARRKKKNGV